MKTFSSIRVGEKGLLLVLLPLIFELIFVATFCQRLNETAKDFESLKQSQKTLYQLHDMMYGLFRAGGLIGRLDALPQDDRLKAIAEVKANFQKPGHLGQIDLAGDSEFAELFSDAETSRELFLRVMNQFEEKSSRGQATSYTNSDRDQIIMSLLTLNSLMDRIRASTERLEISHDLRSPLTSMIGGLTILASGIKGELPPAMKEEAEAAIASAQKLVEFINDLLDFQKLDEGKMPLDLSDHELGAMLSEAVKVVRPLAISRSIEIEAPLENTDLVHCDRDKIVQVIINLLSNAVKFSPEDSSITVLLSSSPNVVKVSIDNQGEPIPEDFRSRIFEPFEQTPASRHQGTGLGLAICKMIVEAHDGAIGLEDVADEDRIDQPITRFWFELKRR